MMLIKTILLSILLVILHRAECDVVDNDVYTLEHSIDQHDFKSIGQLNLRVLKQSLNSAQLLTINEHTSHQKSSSSSYSTKIESDDFDDETRDQLLAYTSSDHTTSNNQSVPVLYRLRLCRATSSQESSSSKQCYASTFTYLPRLIESGFQCNLAIHINPNTNRPNSISLKISGKSSSSGAVVIKKQNRLTMHVTLQSAKLAQQPDTEAYIEKVKREIEQKERAEQSGETQSFWSKYWIYIVPFVVVMFLSNLANPEGGAAAAS